MTVGTIPSPAAEPLPTGPGQAPPGAGRPRSGVRLWHFIVLPPLLMMVLILLGRWLDGLVEPGLSPLGVEVYSALRGAVVGLGMASLIAWLAFSYRREYENQLRARNRQLEQTRDFLSRIIEGSAEAIVTLDASERVTSWNRSAELIYGYTAEQMLGQSLEKVTPPDLREQGEGERIIAALRSGQTLRDYETQRLRSDGRRITVRVTRSPLYDQNGRYMGSTGIVRDVTALKEMEAKLLETERLAAVGELAASVAHEIKNPLAGIRGACEILMDAFAEGDPKRELSGEVLRQIDRLDRTVRDLLLFARPQAKRPHPTDLHLVLDRVVALLMEDSQNRGVAVERRFDPGLPPVMVDPQQVEQVFFNILLNAFQAMDYRGTVTLSTRAEGDAVSVAFRDTGPGIPEEIADKIFQPFFTTRSKGTGLGLAIVRNIVQAHAGTIAARTLPGGGSEFLLTLPRGEVRPS